MARGIDGKMIFQEDEDRLELLRRFRQHRADCGYRCLAWCLMPNHYHLLLRSTEKPPSALMRPLNSGYARWFNKKYERRGYLFQDRYKSVICQDAAYADELIRYVHLNPIRAGIVKSLAALRRWRWCGHAFVIGVPGALGAQFQERMEVLRRFSSDKSKAIGAYLEFLEAGICRKNPEKSGLPGMRESVEIEGAFKGWPAVIGDHEFAREAMRRHDVARHRKHRKADYERVLETLASMICQKKNLQLKELLHKGRLNARSDGRGEFCYLAHYEELIPYAAIARFLGTAISPVAAMAKKRFEGINAG